MRRPILPLAAALLVAIAVVLAACGGGQGKTPTDTGITPGNGAPIPEGGLSIEEALASTLEGPLMVKGFVVAPEDGEMRLCSALLESYPPQCGEPSLVVLGLDLSTIEGLASTTEPDLAQVSWTDVQVSILGEVKDGVITVSTTSG